MSLLEYQGSLKITAEIRKLTVGNEFYTLIMAAMRLADTDNRDKLADAFPSTWNELLNRYNAPSGKLPGE